MPKFATLEEYNALSAAVMMNLSDQAAVSQSMADITEGVTDSISQIVKLKEENEKLSAYNEKLVHANADLFMRQGTVVSRETKHDEPDEGIKIADLFDERGNIK